MIILMNLIAFLFIPTVHLTQITYTQLSDPNEVTAPMFVQSQFGTILNQRYLQKTRPRPVGTSGQRYRSSEAWFGRLRDRLGNQQGRDIMEERGKNSQDERIEGREKDRKVSPVQMKTMNAKKQEKEFTSNEGSLVADLTVASIDLTTDMGLEKKEEQGVRINGQDQVTNYVRRKRKSILFPVSRGGVVSQRYSSSPAWCTRARSGGAWIRFSSLSRMCRM